MAGTLQFSRTRYGIGESNETLTKLTAVQGFALLAPGVQFDDAEDFADEEVWQDKIAAKDIFIVDRIIEQESIKVEDGKYTTPFGQIIKMWDGMRGLRLQALLSKDQDRVLRTYSDLSWTIIYFDRNNTLVGSKNASTGVVNGFELATFFVESQSVPDAGNPPRTAIVIQEADPGEFDNEVAMVQPSWRIRSVLRPLKLVTMTSSTLAAFVCTVVVKFVSTHQHDADGTAYEVPVTGLTEDSFQVLDQAGAAEAVVSVVESTTTPGTYVVTGTDWTSGSIQIIPFVDFTTDPTDPIKDQFESAVVTVAAA